MTSVGREAEKLEDEIIALAGQPETLRDSMIRVEHLEAEMVWLPDAVRRRRENGS